jgi:hypothetical protein
MKTQASKETQPGEVALNYLEAAAEGEAVGLQEGHHGGGLT